MFGVGVCNCNYSDILFARRLFVITTENYANIEFFF